MYAHIKRRNLRVFLLDKKKSTILGLTVLKGEGDMKRGTEEHQQKHEPSLHGGCAS